MPKLASVASVHHAFVTDRRVVAPGITVLGCNAPELVAVTVPGQYVMVTPPGGESAAVALGIYEASGDRMSLLFFDVGKRTHALSELREGDAMTITGPLGNGFDIGAKPQRVAIVAGGVGIASVLLPAIAARAYGASVRLYYGARTKDLLVERERFAAEGCEVIVSTDDGTDGQRGYITDVVSRDTAWTPDVILACGPSPMLRSVARVAEERGIAAQLSLEETFACGVGGCWGCVVPLVRGSAQAPSFPPAELGGSDVVYARICKEGPVFLASELRW